jgi:hypothetical protein
MAGSTESALATAEVADISLAVTAAAMSRDVDADRDGAAGMFQETRSHGKVHETRPRPVVE